MRRQIISSILLICSLGLSTGTGFAADNSRQLQQLQLRLDRMERAIDNQGVYEMQREVNAIDQDVQELRGEMERLRFELDELKAQQREMFIAIDKKLQQMSTVPPSSPNSPATDTGRTASENSAQAPANSQTEHPIVRSDETGDQSTQSETSATITQEMTEEYKSAFILLKQRKYDDAIAAFEAFLAKYSVNKYSANAQYWIAEANYVSKKYPQALQEFTKVVEQFPDSGKVPDARLKIGFTHYELQQWDEAKAELSQLKAQYPNSEIAGLASQRLERMTREGH